MRRQRLKLIFFTMLFSLSLKASELVERVFEGESQNPNLIEAKKEILKKAVEDTSVTLIKEIVGEEKFSRNRKKVYHRVIKNSGKYMSYIKSGKPRQTAEGSISMAVTMKFSLESLQALLLENGLMYDNDGAPIVLPLIVYADRVHLESYRWWKSKKKSSHFLAQQQKLFTASLREEFSKKGFFTLTPKSYQLKALIPEQFKVDQLKKKDYLFLGEFLDTQLIIYGEYKVSRSREISDSYRIELKLYGLHSGNGRVVAEIHRTLNTEPGLFRTVVESQLRKEVKKVSQDIVVQVLETWEKGTFGSSLLQVSLSGAISYSMQEQFKKAIKKQLHSVKNVRERFFSSKRIAFEMDVFKGMDDMKKAFAKLRFGRWRLSLIRSEKGRLFYRPVLVK